MQICKKCGKKKPIARFSTYINHRSPDKTVYRRTECKDCGNTYGKTWKKRNPEQSRHQNLKRRVKKFGLTTEIFYKIHEAQKGLCEVCGCYPFRALLTMDHDHDTGEFRGLICEGCNSSMGHAKDDPKLLRELALYLEKHGKR